MTLCYIDPGTGAALIQIIVATVAAVTLSVKNIRLYLKSLFQNLFKKKDAE